jgi:hypothetical protein
MGLLLDVALHCKWRERLWLVEKCFMDRGILLVYRCTVPYQRRDGTCANVFALVRCCNSVHPLVWNVAVDRVVGLCLGIPFYICHHDRWDLDRRWSKIVLVFGGCKLSPHEQKQSFFQSFELIFVYPNRTQTHFWLTHFLGHFCCTCLMLMHLYMAIAKRNSAAKKLKQ